MKHPRHINAFTAIARGVLKKSGQTYTLNQAAAALGKPSGEVIQDVMRGNVLGLQLDEWTVLIPEVQMAEGNPKTVIAGIPDILAQFRQAHAGAWSALQYLVEPEPNLSGRTPVECLKDGSVSVEEAVYYAQAYLGHEPA